MVCTATAGTNESPPSLKLTSCVLLLFSSVSATIFTEASKLEDGTYPYNTFVIPCAVEAVKLVASSALFGRERVARGESQTRLGFTIRGFAAYAFPAFCYFVSNNCMFYIIRHLGASTFQIMNNLKVLSTGVFMRVFLDRKLSWMQWKALIMLVIGCMVTRLGAETGEGRHVVDQSFFAGYTLVLVSAVASGAGGAFSEQLLKGSEQPEIKRPGRFDTLEKHTAVLVWNDIRPRVAAHGREERVISTPKPVRRIQRVRVRDGGHARHMWSFGILHTQILGQRSEMFLRGVEHAVRRASGFRHEA